MVNYISKAQKGMSKLLWQACIEAKEGDYNIKRWVRVIGSKFLNVETNAQEAVYIVLQLPMRKESWQVIFVNTLSPEERMKLLKPITDFKDMEND